MSQIDIDPYQILNIPHESTLEDVKEAYRQLARTHHPDKGGNQETFKIIKIAFKMIIDNLKKGVPIPKQKSSTFVDMKDAALNFTTTQKQLEPHEFLGQSQPIDPNREFDRNTFNQKFLNSRKDNEDYLISSEDNDYREKRTKQQLLSEQAAIDTELGKIKPMFDPKQFDNNAFQRMFQFINGDPETKALQVYDEPQALVSGLQPFTEIDETHKVKQTDKLSSLGFSGFEESFNGQKNPNQIDNNLLTKFSQQPNITKVNEIDDNYHSTIKKRLNDYQNIQINYHAAPADPKQLPDNLRAKNSATDKVSQQNLSDAYNKKLQERNNLMTNINYGGNSDPTRSIQPSSEKNKDKLAERNLPIKHHALPVMDYPRNSNLPNDGNFTSAETSNRQPTPSEIPSNDDYFAKIPTATQNPQQIYQISPQATPLVPTLNVGYNTLPQLPAYQKTQNIDFEQIQRQLQNLQKTVNEQNKVIRTLTLKKTPTGEQNKVNKPTKK